MAYSPRGQSEISKRSRSVCYKIKEGNPETLQLAAKRLHEHVGGQDILASLFGATATLIPMPRSAPLVQGALWPALKICESIVGVGLAARTVPALERTVAVPKASQAAWGERPGVAKHYDSLRAHARVDVGERILLVDDVVTKGTQALAAVSRLAETYPNATINVFAVIRTKGLVPEIDAIFDPAVGTISLNGDEGDRQP